jgi:hypothetical protein
MESNKKLYLEEYELLKDIGQYQRLVGKLIYLTMTRSDISFVVSLVSKFMHAPRTTPLEAVDRILQYLQKSLGQGISMRKNITKIIIDYSDANWTESYYQKSTTGYCTFVGENLITWKSKKQNVVARSSVETDTKLWPLLQAN